jgi:hypothetical protein
MLSEFVTSEAGMDPPSGLFSFVTTNDEASETRRDGAQDDFSTPADPPEVGMKR